jgi:hypothetical protein
VTQKISKSVTKSAGKFCKIGSDAVRHAKLCSKKKQQKIWKTTKKISPEKKVNYLQFELFHSSADLM